MNIHLPRIVSRIHVVHRSALAMALVAALLGIPRSASALTMQPGDVAKLSYDFSPVLPVGTTVNELNLILHFGTDGPWQVNTTFQFQFFNSDGTAITSVGSETNNFGFPVSDLSGFSSLSFGAINLAGFAQLTSVNANFDLAAAAVGADFNPMNVVNANISLVSTPVSATPLPSTWGMMLLGLGLLGYFAYRRRHSDSVLAAA